MSLPLQVQIEGFDVEDNCLVVGGHKLTDVMGDSEVPLYVYDGDLIQKRIIYLREHLPEEVELHYAIKANPMQEVVELIAPLVDGLDVASGRELQTALRTQIKPPDISFAGPGKTWSELRAALRAGVTLNVESRNELARLSKLAGELNTRARVALRINPNFELKGSGMKMSGGPKPFGIDAEAVPEVLATIDRATCDFVGFHIFSGSQNLSAAALIEAQRQSLELALDLARSAPRPPEVVNIGGGFGIPYFKGDSRLNVAAVCVELERQLGVFKQALPDTRVVIELGRFIVGEAGVYVCRVIDKKVSRGTTFLVTNGGLHHHLAASGNFGQVIRKDYPCLIGNRVHGEQCEPVSVVGPLCTPLDVLAARLNAPVGTDVGDLVVIMQSGAYGRSASPLGFLSHPEPKELLLL